MRAAGLFFKAPQRSLTSLLGLPVTIRIHNAISQPALRIFAGSTRVNPLKQSSLVSNVARPKARSQIAQVLYARLSTTSPSSQEAQTNNLKAPEKLNQPEPPEIAKPEEFERSEKASRAAQLNLSAKLSKEGTSKRKYPVASELWRLVKIAGPESKSLVLAFSLLLVSSAVTLAVPWTIGKIMDQANNPDGKISLFGLEPSTFYLCFGLLLAMGAVSNFGRLILLRTIGERVVARLRTQLYRRTMIQNAEFFDANRVGDLISRLGTDTSIVGKSITSNLSDGLRALVSGCAGLGMMAWVSPHLTSVLFVMLPAFATSAIFFGRAIRNLSRTVQRSIGDLTKIAEERLGNVKTVQAFVGEAPEVGRYSKQVRKLFQLGKRDAVLNAAYFGTNGFLANMMILALLYIGGGMVQSGAITLGQLSSFLLYSAYTGSSMFGLSSFYSELMKGSGAASRLFELQDRHPPVYPSVGDNVRDAKGAIEFKNVKFSYPTRPGLIIFHDLTFRIEEGKNYAIVAPSGAGKSTVASLLLRFYEPNSGTISIAGKDISTMNSQQLRRKIGYVGQEPVLFSGSIAENIAYGRPWATKAEIKEAVEKANCGFIKDFPDTINTQVGARGTQLSGGQKQRIAIARALIKNPDILILDEATSALDAESETLVNQALNDLLKSNRTTISIAHRLSTIKRSDKIIVIGIDGKVAEIGTYADLSDDPDSAFTKLMEWQLTGEGSPKRVSPTPTQYEEVEYDLERIEEDQDVDEHEHEREHEQVYHKEERKEEKRVEEEPKQK